MGVQEPRLPPTFPSTSGIQHQVPKTSQQNSGSKTGNAQFSHVNTIANSTRNGASASQDADIIELDITPPTSPSSLASHLTSRMEEVMANKSSEIISNPPPHPEMIRSLNLIPNSYYGRQSSSVTNNGNNTITPSPFSSGPSNDVEERNMR